jgi:hypothetical protein
VRRDEQFVPEVVLPGAGVPLRDVVGVVERSRRGDARLVVAAGERVEVRYQGVAFTERLEEDLADLASEPPRPAVEVGGVRRVDAEDGAEQPVLRPAGVQLPVGLGRAGPAVVAADVVAPPAAVDVRRRRGERRLEGQ